MAHASWQLNITYKFIEVAKPAIDLTIAKIYLEMRAFQRTKT